MAITGPDVLLYEKLPDRHIAILRINREERGNSLNFDLRERFLEVWADVRADDNVWAAILTGVGDRFFCSGEDLKERAELDVVPGTWERRSEELRKITPVQYVRLPETWKPIIGAINGFSLAGGWYMAQGCDVLISAEHARFGVPEVRWNLPAPFMAQACRMIPMHIALELTLWGARQYTAQRMYEVGWVNKVVPKEQLMDEAIQWAEEVCEMGPAAVRAHKELMWRATLHDEVMVQRLGGAIFERVQAMEDSIEGPRAFAEKRKPQWKLR